MLPDQKGCCHLGNVSKAQSKNVGFVGPDLAKFQPFGNYFKSLCPF